MSTVFVRIRHADLAFSTYTTTSKFARNPRKMPIGLAVVPYQKEGTYRLHQQAANSPKQRHVYAPVISQPHILELQGVTFIDASMSESLH